MPSPCLLVPISFSRAVKAISQRDFPLIQGIIVVIATTYVLVNVVIDMSYRFLDPRIDYE